MIYRGRVLRRHPKRATTGLRIKFGRYSPVLSPRCISFEANGSGFERPRFFARTASDYQTVTAETNAEFMIVEFFS
jgi:hypothetical protein